MNVSRKPPRIQNQPVQNQVPLLGLEHVNINTLLLSRKIFVYSLIAITVAKGIFLLPLIFIYYSLRNESENNDSLNLSYYVDLTRLCWVLLSPLFAVFVSQLRRSFANHVLGILGLGLVGLLLTALPVHFLEHIQESAFLNHEEHTSFQCLSRFEYWLTRLIGAGMEVLLAGGIGLTIHYWLVGEAESKRTTVLQASIAELRHEVLASRLKPHFLFNTLNTISALTEKEPTKSREVVGRLGALLRASIDSLNQQNIELRNEYEFVEDYLAIQKIRFEERLHFELILPVQLETMMVPALLLQPLVENSVKHGLELKRTSTGTVSIHVESSLRPGFLAITVSDDGTSAAHEKEGERSPTGLYLTRERLKLQYGPTAEVEISKFPEQGFLVTLLLPITGEETSNA